MDDLGAEEGAGGKAAKGRKGAGGESTPIWKSQGAVVALAMVAALVLCIGVWFSFFSGGAPKAPSAMLLIDVSTGELYEAKLGKRSWVIPMKNPDTGVRSIFPVRKSDDGQWSIHERYLGAMDGIPVNSSVLIDAENGIVIPQSENAKRLK